MRPALQRLLARPSSLQLLQLLVGRPTPTNSAQRRYITGKAVSNYRRLDESTADEEEATQDKVNPNIHSTRQIITRGASDIRKDGFETISKNGIYDPWSRILSTHDQLEFESNLDLTTTQPRLLDSKDHKNDAKLWAYLLDHRERIYGSKGVNMFWEAIRTRSVQLPTRGPIAHKLWYTFILLGLKDDTILEQVCKLADDLLRLTGERWGKLYVLIIQHLLITGRGRDVPHWHARLFNNHPPGPRRFVEMCRQVVLRGGSMRTLKFIYQKNTHRNAYIKIIPLLCSQENFLAARGWHFFLIKHGDLPPTNKQVEPLLQYLSIYHQASAIKVTKSLVDAGVSFAHPLSKKLEYDTKISAEMMNLVHGKTFGVPVKSYNDGWGARWFATNWISLDIAINAVHALGVRHIGPLSLQAIALREADPLRVHLRIKQLNDIGISIGNSVFSRAIDHFARTRQYESLESLLNGDMHPNEFEDSDLQERLLSEYARANDWTQYKRTFAIRLIGKRSPEIEEENILLRIHSWRRDLPAILKSLSDIQHKGGVVTPKTIRVLLQSILRPRRKGCRPVVDFEGVRSDLRLAIVVLKSLIASGQFVPVLTWREILRRLGMNGQIATLHNLCLYLSFQYRRLPFAIVYGPGRNVVPKDVPLSHPFHPLAILFSVPLQKALVLWGFIHRLKRKPQHPTQRSSPNNLAAAERGIPDITSGIVLLRALHERGVAIDWWAIKKVILQRLVTYYGPDQKLSNKRYNRQARDILGRNPDATLWQLAAQIDDALGTPTFTSLDLPQVVSDSANHTLRRLHRRGRPPALKPYERRLRGLGRGHMPTEYVYKDNLYK